MCGLGSSIFVLVFSVHVTWDRTWSCCMNKSCEEELRALRMTNLEKEKSLGSWQNCCLWILEGLTCSRRRAKWIHYVGASNRQIFICHMSAEEQHPLKTKTWKRKKLHSFSGFIFFQGIFMVYLLPPYFLFPYFLQGSLYEFPNSAGSENSSFLSAYLLSGEWWFSLGHYMHNSRLRIP